MDPKLIPKFLNKTFLVAITYLTDKEEFIESKQYFGIIVRINQKEGIVIKEAKSGEEFNLPPDLDSIQEAKPGEYRLHSTGEVIMDPDYLAIWTVTQPPPG